MIKGQPARAWPVAALPAALRERLEDLADVHCYGRNPASVERFLVNGRRRWRPALPIGKLPQAQIELARTRCKALAPVLREMCGQPVAGIISAALPAWRSVGGYDVNERTMRRWIERAIVRDFGFNDWDRWEIYLDNEITSISHEPDTTAARLLDTPRLEEMIAAVSQPSALKLSEQTQVWAAAMNDTSVLISAGHSAAEAQRTILRVLAMSGLALARSSNALRVSYRRKWAAWQAGGGRLDAIVDRRAAAARSRKFALPTCDILTLIKSARQHGGQLSCAYREAHRLGRLSQETLARFPILPTDKSFVPHSIRRAVMPFLAPIAINGLGSRARRLNGPHIVRTWESVDAGDVFEFDDLTLPLYWWIENPTYPSGFYFGAGQVLLAVDSKTGYILSWILIARPGYNARDIIRIVREVHDAYGLPKQHLLFERGIWKNAKMISGEPSERDKGKICEGLASIWPVRHTTTPTGKAIVERTFGLMQDRMEHIPGYTGRDMRKDCPQATHEAIAAVKSGREHPSKHFLHASQVMSLLEQIAASINDEPLGIRTKRIPGQSPRQAFAARETASMQYFPPEAEHLFKTHRLEQKVTIEGIRLPPSLDGAVYRSEATGALIGQRVLCWVDPLDLSSIFVTDLDGNHPRLVERAEVVDAHRGGEVLARARRQSADHMQFVDVLARATKTQLRPTDFRPVLVDGVSRHLGAEMRQQKQAHAARQRAATSLSRQFDKLSSRHGLNVPKPAEPDRLRDMVAGLQVTDEHWREVERRAQEDVEL